MDAVFTINYGEFKIADILSKKVKCSIFIPSSRQEKGIDLIMYRFSEMKNMISTVQVKQSRVFEKQKIIDVDNKKINIVGSLWFNKINVPDNADWIMLIGMRFVETKQKDNFSCDDFILDPLVLAFKNDEMKEFSNSIKQKLNPNKNDHSFYISFDKKGNVYQTRGCAENRILNRFLLKNRIEEIEKSFK